MSILADTLDRRTKKQKLQTSVSCD